MGNWAADLQRMSRGTTIQGVTREDIDSLPILLPPLPEQRAIAAVLDSIDDAIEGAEAVIAATERLRDALLHDLLTRGLPGQHAEWRDVPGLGTIPADWQVMRLGDVADVAFSSVDKKTVAGEVPVELCNYTDVFYNRRIRAGMELMAATATLSERDKWSLKTGDVLFTKDSETPDEIGIPSCVAEDMPNVLCGYHLGLARPRTDIVEGAFLADALGSSESRRQFSRIANGVTRFGLTLDATKALPILLPPLTEQRAIVAVLDGIEQALKVVQDEWEGLLLLKASTAEALLKGRVRATPLNTRSATPLVSNATSGLARSLIKSPFLGILGGVDRSLRQSPFLDILGGLDRSLKQSPFLDILGGLDRSLKQSPFLDILGGLDRSLRNPKIGLSVTLAPQLATPFANRSREAFNARPSSALNLTLTAVTATKNSEERSWSTADGQEFEGLVPQYEANIWLSRFDQLVTDKDLHRISRNLFANGHYSFAVLRAYNYLDKLVKAKSGLTSTTGADLMRKAFRPESPIITLNNLISESEKNEQRGYMDIFAGAMTAIRNPRAHEPELEDDPEVALRLLVMASQLIYILNGSTLSQT